MGSPEEFGFAPPRVAIRLEQPDQDIELQLGDFTPLEDKLYARSPGRPGVFTVSRQLLNFLPFTANYWRDQHLLHLSRANQLEVDHIQIKSGPRQLTLQQSTNEIWHISQPQPTKRANQTRITKTLINLWNWNVVDFVSDDPKVDLQPYGLQSPEAELILSRGTNRLAAVQFGHSPTNQPGMVYARLLQHTNVVIIPSHGSPIYARRFGITATIIWWIPLIRVPNPFSASISAPATASASNNPPTGCGRSVAIKTPRG